MHQIAPHIEPEGDRAECSVVSSLKMGEFTQRIKEAEFIC